MEPANNKASNLAYHEILDDNLEKIVQDFNEFQTVSGASNMTLEDLIDIYITSRGVNPPVDLNESKSTVPPHRDQSAHGFNLDRDIHLSDIMTDMSQNDTGSLPDSSPAVNTNSHEGAGASNGMVTHIKYGDLKCQGVADRIIGSCSAETVFQSVMKSFRTPGAGQKNLQQQVHVKEDSDGTTSRKYTKRKYKQIMETKEEAGAKERAKRQVTRRSIYLQNH